MNLILQAIKSLFRKLENNIAKNGESITKLSTRLSSVQKSATKALSTANSAKATANGKMSSQDPVGTGSFSMNRKAGSSVGTYSHVEGYDNVASGWASHAEGGNTTATRDTTITATVKNSWISSESYAHAEGYGTVASNLCSHAEGNGTTASGTYSHAEGYGTTASGYNSHAEGNSTKASGPYSHAEGYSTTASGNVSHAEGFSTTASGYASHAEGYNTTAKNDYAHAEGYYTNAGSKYQHVQGKHNVVDSATKYAHIVGNGTNTYARSNAHTLDWNGLGWFAGGLKVGGAGQDDESAVDVALKTDIPSTIVQTVNGIAPDKNGNVEVGVSDSSQSATVDTFTTQYIGQLFDPPADYTFWSPQTLVYDPNIKKYVDLLFCTTYHLADDSAHTLWVTYIDPETFEASEPVQCAYMDGGTVLTPPDAGCAAFIILDDGRYMQINRPTSSSTDMYLFYSEDYGKTWVKGELASGFDTTNEVYYIVRLSNGRLLANNTAIPYIYYSDDGGKNWSKVRPTTCGGNLESEINFFEVKAGVVIAIGRYSMSGMGVNESGDCQHAIISYSEDYGTTWTPWKLSETIDNMNASCCSGYLHDGVLELFVGSRWYHYGANATTDYINTGKSGAIMHYTATIENALADNFTKLGVVVYSKAVGDMSSQDFHTPCVAVNGKEMLMVYCDRVPPYTVADKANHYYVRGSLDGLDYGVRDDLKSNVFPMSSAKVNALINRAKNELTVKINEAILSGNLIPPNPDDDGNPGTYVFDDIVCNFDYLDEAKYNAENVTLTDTINNVVGTFVAGGNSTNISRQTTPDTLPEIRDNSASLSTLYIPKNILSQFVGDDSTEITVEISQYRYTGDTLIGGSGAQFYSNSAGGGSTTVTRTGCMVYYTNTAGADAYKSVSHQVFIPTDTLGVLVHAVLVVADDGSVKLYFNGKEVKSDIVGEDFARFAAGNFSRNQYFRGHMKAVRIYNRALTAEEVATNYAYEKATIV